jgi:hypothetical protein
MPDWPPCDLVGASTTSFMEAYGTLQKHAATLRDQKEPNIDDTLACGHRIGERVQGLPGAD